MSILSVAAREPFNILHILRAHDYNSFSVPTRFGRGSEVKKGTRTLHLHVKYIQHPVKTSVLDLMCFRIKV